jgi:hypothetical protein
MHVFLKQFPELLIRQMMKTVQFKVYSIPWHNIIQNVHPTMSNDMLLFVRRRTQYKISYAAQLLGAINRKLENEVR